jgi:late competence protein required for DNA uptake (superfamily II DNA/RNA helicase)
VGLKPNETHQLLAYADDVNILVDNIDTLQKNTDISLHSSNEVGLEVNVRKTKYILMSAHRHTGQNQDIQTANRTFERVSQFRYLGMTLTSTNLIQEVIKRRPNSGNA